MTLPRPLQAVVFDMDGLLFDTEAVARDSFYVVTARRGLEAPMEVYVRMIGQTGEASRGVLQAHFGRDFDVDAFWTAWEGDWTQRLKAGVSLKAGVTELLDLLDERDIPRAIATSSPHWHVDERLAEHGLAERFAAVVARGDYARGKPHPDPFLKAAEALGADPAHCLALEDSHNGVRAAHAAGMMTVMVPDLLHATDEIGALCVRVAESLHEVRDLVAAMAGHGAGARS